MIFHLRDESTHSRGTGGVRSDDRPRAPRLAARWLSLPASALLAVTLGSGCDPEVNCAETATCTPTDVDAAADRDAVQGEAGGNAGKSGGAGSGGSAGADASSGRGGAGGNAGTGGAGGSAGTGSAGGNAGKSGGGAGGSAGKSGGGAGGSADASGGSGGNAGTGGNAGAGASGGTAGAGASGGSGGSAGSGGTAGSAGFAGNGGSGGAAGTATVDAGGGGRDSGVDGGPDGGVVCSPNATQCSGNGVQTCNASGQWDPAIACPFVCSGGTCTGVCSPRTQQCSGNGVQTCGSTGQWGAAVPCAAATPHCVQGTCTVPPSCEGGGAGQSNCSPSSESCCTSPTVPGGTYNRSNNASYPATVSDFRLDKYEITVGRFRKFVAAYSQNMIASGAGKNPNNASDTGWDTAWNASLPADATALTMEFAQCVSASPTWTPSAADNESRPINCITWYLAEAFCIWDGGRLPTEAEWNYAAAGGSEQRLYPWGPTAPGVDSNLAVYGCYYNGNGTCMGVTSIASVGSASAGNGKWGQADLAGNESEWVQDWYANDYLVPCDNCANLTASTDRSHRGGYFSGTASDLRSYSRVGDYPSARISTNGARCSRTP